MCAGSTNRPSIDATHTCAPASTQKEAGVSGPGSASVLFGGPPLCHMLGAASRVGENHSVEVPDPCGGRGLVLLSL